MLILKANDEFEVEIESNLYMYNNKKLILIEIHNEVISDTGRARLIRTWLI